MTKTIAVSYAQTCFDYSKGIKEWYNKLKEQVSMNVKREIKALYRPLSKPLLLPNRPISSSGPTPIPTTKRARDEELERLAVEEGRLRVLKLRKEIEAIGASSR